MAKVCVVDLQTCEGGQQQQQHMQGQVPLKESGIVADANLLI